MAIAQRPEVLPTSGTVPDAPRRHRASRLLIAALLLAVAAGSGAGWLAWSNHQTGLAWQERHEQVAADLADTEEALADARTEAEDLSQKLDHSEDDVRRLENRIDALANEKAVVEDERNAMVVEAASWRSLSEMLDDTAEGMDECIDMMGRLSDLHVQQWNDAMAGFYVDVGPINRLSDQVFAFCDEVRQDAWVARQFLSDLQ